MGRFLLVIINQIFLNSIKYNNNLNTKMHRLFGGKKKAPQQP